MNSRNDSPLELIMDILFLCVQVHNGIPYLNDKSCKEKKWVSVKYLYLHRYLTKEN